MSAINPRHWDRSRQLALAVAAAIGAVVGLVIGAQMVDPYQAYYWKLSCSPGYYSNCTYVHPGYWLKLGLWLLFGASIGAGIVYVQALIFAETNR